MLFFWFFKNCELIRDSFLWRSNFIPLVRDSIIIIGSRCYTYTFSLRFDYKRWVRVSIKNLNFSFLGQVFQYFCWVSKRVDWGSHQNMSSSSYYSGSSHHSCSAASCRLWTALTLNNFGRRFYGCSYYDVVSNSWFSYFFPFLFSGFVSFQVLLALWITLIWFCL